MAIFVFSNSSKANDESVYKFDACKCGIYNIHTLADEKTAKIKQNPLGEI